jgi:hypothetical protein
MYDRMLDLEGNEDQFVLSQWSESSGEGKPKRVTKPVGPVGNHFKKEKREINPPASKELSKKLMSPELKQIGDSSIGFDTFNPSKKQSSLKESKPVMNSINEEDSRLQSNMFTTNELYSSLKNPLDSVQFMTKSDGYHLKKMPRINSVLKKRNGKNKPPKWKQHLLNLRKRKQRRKRIQNSSKVKLKLKKPITKNIRKKRIRQKNRRTKQKLKKMLKNYLAKFPWKNKKLFNHRQKMIKKMKRYGTMPGSRLLERKSKEHLLPEKYYHNWDDKSYKMWSIKGSPLMKKDIFRSASVGGNAILYDKVTKSDGSKKSKNKLFFNFQISI